MKHIAVVGAGYGDEGKGLATSYFARHNRDAIVVRHNGTSQASHTVRFGSVEHRFSHFGSGTFEGRPTYLADTFVFNPATIESEYRKVSDLGFGIRALYSPDCNTILPGDIALTQARAVRQRMENGTGDGTCGMGLYQAFKREKYLGPICSIADILELRESGRLTDFLGILDEEYYKPLIERLGFSGEVLNSYYCGERLYEKFFAGLQIVKDEFKQVGLDALKGKQLIFEGAQGLGLDPNYGVMPHCTPSNTGLQNPVALLNGLGESYELEAHYVTRTYSTRHGPGPFDNVSEDYTPFGHKSSFDEMLQLDTNKSNCWQGAIRYAPLEDEKIGNRIFLDYLRAWSNKLSGSAISSRLFVTWADHLAVKEGNENVDRFNACTEIGWRIGTRVGHYSVGPRASDVIKVEASSSNNTAAVYKTDRVMSPP